jgi:hypothetical protein
MDCATPDWLAHLSVGNLQAAAISISFNAPAALDDGMFPGSTFHTLHPFLPLPFPSSSIYRPDSLRYLQHTPCLGAGPWRCKAGNIPRPALSTPG